MGILDTGVRNVRNVLRYNIGAGALTNLPELLAAQKMQKRGPVIFFIDEFFITCAIII